MTLLLNVSQLLRPTSGPFLVTTLTKLYTFSTFDCQTCKLLAKIWPEFRLFHRICSTTTNRMTACESPVKSRGTLALRGSNSDTDALQVSITPAILRENLRRMAHQVSDPKFCPADERIPAEKDGSSISDHHFSQRRGEWLNFPQPPCRFTKSI